MSSEIKFLVLGGDGINCDNETAFAFREGGVHADIVHINDLRGEVGILQKYDGLVFPGGFSFGDELGPGQVLAQKIKYSIYDQLFKFIENKKPILGICNGFQVLIKLGILPDPTISRTLALDRNIESTFVDRWCDLAVNRNSNCVWSRYIDREIIKLPSRHGEGRVVLQHENRDSIYQRLKEQGQIVFEYEDNFNGSFKGIAAICDPSGLVLGMMPHPEAYIFNATSNDRQRDDMFELGDGSLIIKSVIKYLKGRES